jgi:hypothetical protein
VVSTYRLRRIQHMFLDFHLKVMEVDSLNKLINKRKSLLLMNGISIDKVVKKAYLRECNL